MRGDNASTSTFGILGALLVFSMSFSIVVGTTSTPSTIRLDDLSLQREADLLADRLLSPAVGAGRWTSSPDALTTFGLSRGDASAHLDSDSIRLLARAALDSRENAAPDYADVKAVLGVEHDFHLRIAPIAPAVADKAWEPLPVRVAYFGHYSGARAAVAVDTTITESTASLNVSVTITNRASVPAVFTTNIALGDASNGRSVVTQDRHTTLLASSESQVVWVEVPALNAWSSKINAVRVSVTDPYGNAATDAAGALIPTPWIAVTMPTAPPLPHALVLQAANPYYVAGADVNFEVDAHDGRGARVEQATARLVLLGPEGREWSNETVTVPTKAQPHVWTCANCTTVGNYTAKLLDGGGRTVALDRVHVSEERMFTTKRTPDAVASSEILILDALVASFDPTRHDATTGAGDVFGDDVNGPTELPAVLSRYDIVVVGSDASHHALSPADVKRSITAWIDAGGTLVVFGTAQEPSRWLQSEYGLALGSASGAPASPDPEHPLLVDPEALDHARYPAPARSWRIPLGETFDHVLTFGAGPDGSTRDALALSEPGSFGAGRVALTSYRPGTLASALGEEEATRFVHNLLAHQSGRVAADFGPPVPAGVPVAASSRVVAASDPTGDVVIVRVTVHAFRS